MTATTRPEATPAKLRDGTWGARYTGITADTDDAIRLTVTAPDKTWTDSLAA